MARAVGEFEYFAQLMSAVFRGDVRVTDAIEDAWVFNPASEIFNRVAIGFIAVSLKASALQVNAGGFMIAAAEFSYIVTKDAEGAELAGELVWIRAVPCSELGGIAGDEESGEMV
jgi:hypothetical protein